MGKTPELGRRLLIASLQSAGMALVFAGVLMSGYAYYALRADLVETLQVQAGVTAHNSAAPILFKDAAAATETLSSLRAAPSVMCAVLLEITGSVLARYPPAPAYGDDRDALCLESQGASGAASWEHKGLLYVSAPVTQAGRQVGRIVVGASMRPLLGRVGMYIAVSGLTAGIALLLAYVGVLRIRRDMDKTELELQRLVYVDPVSNLFNRRAANNRIEALQLVASNQGFVLALLDLDDFKMVNDTLGHLVGDELLLQLGQRLSAGLGSDATVYRYGGDEFLLIVPNAPASAKSEWGIRILELFAEQLIVGPHQLTVRGSIGLAHSPEDATDIPSLLRAADTAMYKAKHGGKHAYAVFNSNMDLALRRRLRLLAELRGAIDHDELSLEYQPIVSLANGDVVGVEALVRWHHPELGTIGPVEFIPAAEESGLIIDIGQWVLDAACRQLCQWRELNLRDVYVAVNVSAKQLGRGLSDQVLWALKASGLPARALQVEITEYSIVEALDTNVAELAALRASGVKVAIDDFGTGLSSLGYLKRLPIDKLKIDRTFVKDLPGGEDDAAIATMIISLAQHLGLSVVAEGIETQQQCDWLRNAGCEFGQGYLFSRPVSPQKIERMLRGVPRLNC